MGKVHCSDAGKFIRRLPDQSIDFAMTSPPYWGLRDYGVKGQIGLETHPQEYVDKLASIFQELKRVLKPHGCLYLNLGDTYCSAKGSCFNAGGGPGSIKQRAYKQLARMKNPNRMLKPDGSWLQAKQLLMIPSHVAIALQEDGWILRNDIIWYKPNGLPSSVKDRLANKYEHVFHFVKSRRYFYDLDAIRVPHKRGTPRAEHDFRRMMEGGERFTGKWSKGGLQRAFVAGHARGKNPGDVYRSKTFTASYKGVRASRNPPEPGQPNAFHKLGRNPGDVMRLTKHELALGKYSADSLHRSAYCPLGKNPGDFWEITTKPFPSAHFAVYPEDLCLPPILSSCPRWVCRKCAKPASPIQSKMTSSSQSDWRKAAHKADKPLHAPVAHVPGGHTGLTAIPNRRATEWKTCDCNAGFEPGIVFDPFAGAGTTVLVAKKLGRRWLGCDLNPRFVRMANERVRRFPGGEQSGCKKDAKSFRARQQTAGSKTQ